MTLVAVFAFGVLVGAVIARAAAGRPVDPVAAEQRAQQLARLAVDQVIAVAQQALGASVQAGAADVATTRQLVDQRLDALGVDLHRAMERLVAAEADRARRDGELAAQLRETGRHARQLADTTEALRTALASTKTRGQWGERMADDVLRLAGFVEGVNYRRQRSTTTGGIPDFTFILPRGQVLYLDVKFPLENYLRALEAPSGEAERFRAEFLRDVRLRVRELARRDYAAGQDAVDCVLLFIPNEAVYAAIHEADASVAEEALANKVVLCSPLTLFAVLAVIRQAVDNFTLERTSAEILEVLGEFARQWEMWVDGMDKLGARLDGAAREYDALVGTRRRQLEKRLDRINDLRRRHDSGAQPALDLAGPPLTERSAS